MMEWRAKGLQQNREHPKPQRHVDEDGVFAMGPTKNNSRYRRTYNHARPPIPYDHAKNVGAVDGSYQRQSVPLWERRFCTDVCQVPWNKLCQTKKIMSMYNNIVQWNDSAGEDAFKNAKARFWAKINKLPCDIPKPDPDMYIDVVDHDTFIDPQLIEDLYKQPPIPEDDENDEVCRWDSFLFANTPVPVSGWGDSDDSVTNKGFDSHHPIVATGWDDSELSLTRNIITTEPCYGTLKKSSNDPCDVVNSSIIQNQQKMNSAHSTVNVSDYGCWNSWNDEQVAQDKPWYGSVNNKLDEQCGRNIDGHFVAQGNYSSPHGYYNTTNNFKKGRGRKRV